MSGEDVSNLSDLERIQVTPQSKKLLTHNGRAIEGLFNYKIRSNLHDEYTDLGSLTYDIPSNTGLNIVLNVRDKEGLVIPLAGSTLTISDGIPTVVMLQRVKAFTKQLPSEEENRDSLIKVIAHYFPVTHPYKDLLQGDNRLDWEMELLKEVENLAKNKGFNEIRLKSGFQNPYITNSYPLAMSVQQYDLVAERMGGWIPITTDGTEIVGPDRMLLGKIIRDLRSKKLRTEDDIKSAYPEAKLPAHWSKKL